MQIRKEEKNAFYVILCAIREAEPDGVLHGFWDTCPIAVTSDQGSIHINSKLDKFEDGKYEDRRWRYL